MPTAWLQRRSAFALSLFFPGFPFLPLSPPATEPPAVAVEARAVGEPQTAAPAPEEPQALPGVVIEDIPKDSALEKAGLRVGDVILSWQRLPNSPANPEASQGELTSYFDWWDFEVEQAPRGPVVLGGLRGGKPLAFTVEPGLVEATARPVLSPDLEKIYLKGRTHLISGNLEEAVREWNSLAAGLRRRGNRDLQAWIALRIAEACGEQGDWEKEFEWFHDALEAAETPSARIASWQAVGDAHEARNEYSAAEKAYASAIEISQKVYPASLGVAICLNDLGFLAWSQRKLDQARDYMLRAQKIQEQLAPQSLSLATTQNNLGLLAQVRGELDRAGEYHLRALQLREQLSPQSRGVANSLNNLGAVAWDRGDLGQARDCFLQALRIQERLAPQSIAVAEGLSNLGSVVTAQGEYDRGHDYFLQALRIEERVTPQSLSVATILNNLGHVAAARGEMDRAEDFYGRGLKIEEKLAPQSLEVASSLSNLGTIVQLRGQVVRAHDHYLKALRIQVRVAAQGLDVATSLSRLGEVARLRGDLDLSYKYHSRALGIQERLSPRSLAVATSLNNLSDVARLRGDLNRASEYGSRALLIQQELSPQSAILAASLKNLGTIERSRGELDRAHNYYGQALEALEHQILKLGGSYNTQAGFRTQHGEYYSVMLDLLFNQGSFPEAFHVLERFRAQTLLSMLAERDTAFTADIPEELDRERRRLGVRYDRILKKLTGFNLQDNNEEIEATRKELQHLEDEAGDLEASIRKASPRLAELKYPQPLDVEHARQALDPGTLLLSYSVGKEKTALFALSCSGDLEVKILPVGEATLRSQVKRLLSLIRETVQGSSLGVLRKSRVQAASRELYAALLGPVAGRIAASERLLILPDGPLHLLPFAALVRNDGAVAEGGGGQYLAEWKPLHVALSATVFAELKQRRRPAGENNAPQAPIQLAAFGDPVYPQSLTKAKGDSVAALPTATGLKAPADVPRGDPIVRSVAERGVFDWPPLPYTRHEVEGIASLFPAGTARTFLGAEALEERVKSLDPKTRILHLAAHGYTDEHLPSSSFIALTIPEDTNPDAAGPERDNGLLQVWEIFERVRLDADLVVLSGCDTGLGEEQGGEGLIGLTRAFQYAGARTVMASLWSVRDQATSELMIRFYKHLRAGLSKDEALRQAQVELIRGPIEVVNKNGEKTLFDASAPYFWAGFQVYGDWQ